MATKRELRMGLREGTGKGHEYSVSPSIYFHRRGGHFVFIANGLASLCASGQGMVAGWAETPKDTSGKDSYKTGSSDKMFVIYPGDNVFVMPVDEAAASLAGTMRGRGAGIVNSGATHAMIQKAKLPGSVTASPLSILEVDTDNKLVYVTVKKASIQAK